MTKQRFKHFLNALPLIFLLFSGYAHAENTSDLSSVFIVDCKTSQSYGLNSYYLYARQPVFEAHSYALKQTEYLLRKISKAKKAFKKDIPKNQHVFYIPVSFEPQSWVQRPEEGDFAAASRWVMNNYDFQCAKKLLSTYSHIYNHGPYILSSLMPLDQQNIQQQVPQSPRLKIPTLIQDLSNTSNEHSKYWLSLFFRKSWQPRQWQPEDVVNLQLSLLEDLYNHELLLVEEAMRVLNEQRLAKIPAMEEQSIEVTPLELIPPPFSSCNQYAVNENTAPIENIYKEKITIQLKEI